MSADEFAGFDLDKVRKQAEAARNKKPEEKKTVPAKPRKQKSIQVPQAPAVIPVSAAPKQSRFCVEYNPIRAYWEIKGLGLSEQFDFRLADRTIAVYEGKISYLQPNREWEKLASVNLRKDMSLPASMLLHYELFRSLYKNKDGAYKNEIGVIKQFVSKELSDNWVSALTKINYNASPKLDQIVHTNTVTDKSITYQGDISAPDCVIDGKCSASDRDNACSLLLGTTNTQEVYDVFKWLTGYEPVLQRLPSKVIFDKTAYLMMHTEKSKMRILAMATPETSGTAFGFYRIKPI